MATVISVPTKPKKPKVEVEIEEKVEEPVVEPEVEEEELQEEEPDCSSSDTTIQTTIPLRFRIAALVCVIICVLSGLWLAYSNTEVPIEIVDLNIESSESGNSILVKLRDRVHSRVDLYKDNARLNIQGTETAGGLLFSNLSDGIYLVHAINVKHSSIAYGMQHVNLVPANTYNNVTEYLRTEIAKIPDEGNKFDVLADLYNNFDEVANAPADSNIDALMKESNSKTKAILGFDGDAKFKDESPWYNLFKKDGGLPTFLKNNNIMITRENFKQLYRAIANGMKE